VYNDFSSVRCTVVLQSYVIDGSVKERQLIDLISQMLKYKPSERITVADAVCHPFFSSVTV